MDARGLAGMATRANAAHFRLNNYGARVLQNEVTVESVAAAIACYDLSEALRSVPRCGRRSTSSRNSTRSRRSMPR